MKELFNDTKKLFFLGIIGAVFSVLGDFLLSFTQYPNAGNNYYALLYSCEYLSYTRLALSAFFGAVGIPMQAFGLFAFSKCMKDKKNRITKGAKTVSFGALMTALFGGAVHLMCVIFMFVVKLEAVNGFDPQVAVVVMDMIPESLIPFIIFAVLPLSLICMGAYFIALITMFLYTIKGKTIFAKWSSVFNPIVFVVLLQLIAMMFHLNTPLFNGLNMANKAIGALFTFTYGYIVLNKIKRKKR